MQRRPELFDDFENFDEDEDLGSLSPSGSPSAQSLAQPLARPLAPSMDPPAAQPDAPAYQRTSEMRRGTAAAATRSRAGWAGARTGRGSGGAAWGSARGTGTAGDRRGSARGRDDEGCGECRPDADGDAESQAAAAELSGAKLLHKALQMQVRREHTQLELRRKLARWCSDSAAIDQVLEELQRRGWQSDQRFAEGYVARKAGSHGVASIRQDLKQVGLAKDMIAEHVEPLQDSEFERARAVWARRFSRNVLQPAEGLSRQQMYLLQQKERARQMRFLAARGFSPSVIQRVVRSDPGEDPDLSQAYDSDI